MQKYLDTITKDATTKWPYIENENLGIDGKDFQLQLHVQLIGFV